LDQSFDYIITVCDRANDNCPTFPGDNVRIHWSFDDPAKVAGDVELQRQKFLRVRGEISDRIRLWVTVQRKGLKEAGLLD
jgi:arsenate reductase